MSDRRALRDVSMGLLDKLFGSTPQVLPTSVRDVRAFEREVEKSEIPVIVDVWGPSCGPCKKLEPVLVEIATKYAGKVKVVEISTEGTVPQLLGELEVRATPTLIVYKRGEELGRMHGYRPASWFDEMIAKELLG